MRARCCAWPPVWTRAANTRWLRPSCSAARERKLTLVEPEGFESESGIGVRGTVEGSPWRWATPP